MTNWVRKVLEFRCLALRLVRERVVLQGLRAADVINPDDQRLEVRGCGLGPDVEHDEAQGDQRDGQQGDLEVRVHDQR